MKGGMLHKKTFQFGAILSIWLLVASISASRLYIEFGYRYDGGWLDMYVRQLPVWLPWALVTPLILFISKKIREEFGLTRSVLTHVFLSLIVLFSYTLIQSSLGVMVYQLEVDFYAYWIEVFLGGLGGNLLIYLAILIIMFSGQWYRSLKESQVNAAELRFKTSELEKQLAEAQVDALTSQLNPHFMFNSLHSIASLVRADQREDAINMIGGLGELLRQSIEKSQVTLVSLDEEIDFIKKYLSIEKIRFGENLNIEYQIDSDTLKEKVPRFILQPLVENALKHGLRDLENEAILKVEARKNEDWLSINIKDNGKGFCEENVKEEGLGLSNVKQRLKTLYEDRFEFKIHSLPENGKGTNVELNLPVV